MHKRTYHIRQTRSAESRRRIGPTRMAGRLLLVGLPVIVCAAGAYAARIRDGMLAGDTGLFLRLGPDGEAILAAIALLLGGALLLDWQERRDGRH